VKLIPYRTVLAGLACVLGLALAMSWGLPGRLPAADPPPKAAVAKATADPLALRLLDDVARAYRELKVYSDQGEFGLAETVDGKTQSVIQPMKLSLERPNKLRFDAGQVLVVSDGKSSTTVVEPIKKYSVAEAPQAVTLETFRQGPLGSVIFGGYGAMPMYVVLSMLTGGDTGKLLGQFGGVLKIDPDRPAAGVVCKALRVEIDAAPDIRLLIDPQTKLLRSVDLVIDPKEMAEKGLGKNVSIDRFGWTSGPIATRDLPADTFAYKPAKEFTKVESIARALEEAGNPVNEFVGKPAPSFTLTVLDGPGKTRTLSKDDLAGKVVLIDFWATWCGPCMMELPEIQKMVASYAKDKKEVLIVALSQDDQPAELPELRKLVEKTLADNKIDLTGTPVGLIGLDPSHSVGDAFKVSAYPTVVLLDGQGVVQAAHVGVPNGEVAQVIPVLGKAIDTLLEGKSLAVPARAEGAAAGAEEKAKK
jgi:thiol-disulfide isomerase/thioredoxin